MPLKSPDISAAVEEREEGYEAVEAFGAAVPVVLKRENTKLKTTIVFPQQTVCHLLPRRPVEPEHGLVLRVPRLLVVLLVLEGPPPRPASDVVPVPPSAPAGTHDVLVRHDPVGVHRALLPFGDVGQAGAHHVVLGHQQKKPGKIDVQVLHILYRFASLMIILHIVSWYEIVNFCKGHCLSKLAKSLVLYTSHFLHVKMN